MRVLASVYACSPYDGSERAVGWNWIKELDKYHKITALTSLAYKKDIEDYCKKNPNVIKNTKFIYIDVPHTSWHVGYRLERLYYILWQKQATLVAKRLLEEEQYDLVHHITYVTCILPTEMYKLNLPFLYGPVSGGENTPKEIKYPMSSRDKITEIIRSSAQVFFRLTPNFYRTMKGASLILTTTEETKKIIPLRYQNKVEVFQSIGLPESVFIHEKKKKTNKIPRFLMAGRMLYWKGFELGIKAFIKALEKGARGELVILGDTEGNSKYEDYRNKLKMLCGDYLNKNITFVSKIEHSQMNTFYDSFDVLINCSLRDSGCFIVMEAMSRGLPLIVVNTGGPKVNTTPECAIKINPAPMKDMIEDIADAIILLGKNKVLREKMGESARKIAYSEFEMSNKIKKINCYYEKILSLKLSN